MHRILLVLSTTRYSKDSVRNALAEARGVVAEGDAAVLHVLYLHEEKELERVHTSVGQSGFLGLRPQREVIEELTRQHQRVARLRVNAAARLAKRIDGLAWSSEERSGDYVEVVHDVLEGGDFDVLWMTRADRPFISRLLFGSVTEEVARLAKDEGLADQVTIEV